MKTQQGFTLLELMLGLVLSLVIVRGIYHVTQVVESHYGYLRAMARSQEAARLAFATLSDAIMHAGFTTCGVPLPDLNGIEKNTPLQGRKKNQQNSDRLLVRRMATKTAQLQHAAHGELTIKGIGTLKADRPGIICDCLHCDIFQIQKVEQVGAVQHITSQPRLSDYDKLAEVSPLLEDNYFIADTGRRNFSREKIFGLFVETIEKKQFEWVEGVIQLKFSFIYDENSKRTGHLKEPLGVMIDLLTRSENKVTTGPFTYRFLGVSHVITDGYFYQGWRRYVPLRQKY